MYRLISSSQQQPSASAELDAGMSRQYQKTKAETQPGRRLPIWKQGKAMYYWQPYPFQTRCPNCDEHGPSPNTFPQVSTYDKVSLPILDPEAMIHIYEKAFERFQQNNCRVLAKAYIKILAPRKQVEYPYNGRKSVGGRTVQLDPETTKPRWWPSRVRHCEPDHLLKVERIRLLVHIVRELGASHGMTVDMLKAADRPIRDQIRPRSRLQFLEEIYKIRKEEERLLSKQTGSVSIGFLTSCPDILNEPKRANTSALLDCTEVGQNSTKAMGVFVGDWAYLSDENASFTPLTHNDILPYHLTARQNGNFQDTPEAPSYPDQPAVPFHVTPSQWEPGPLEASPYAGVTTYPLAYAIAGIGQLPQSRVMN
ncbi:hypothetical protein N7540_003246 [Penicillium herquei]|nr:hypothetical protein N7540_003246 [Penicillium herquei]